MELVVEEAGRGCRRSLGSEREVVKGHGQCVQVSSDGCAKNEQEKVRGPRARGLKVG